MPVNVRCRLEGSIIRSLIASTRQPFRYSLNPFPIRRFSTADSVFTGTPIRAAASGTIISQYYNGAYGNRVILNNGVKRGKSIVTTYNHLSRFAKSSGATVLRGEVIGYVGTTGYSTGCHLHFMVIANGYTTNPMGWL